MGIVSFTKVAGPDYDELHKQVERAGPKGTPVVADVLKHALHLEGHVKVYPNSRGHILNVNVTELPKPCTIMLLQGTFYLDDDPDRPFTETYVLMELVDSKVLRLMENSAVAVIWKQT
ncbi:hypothetical protein DL95DRAFT_399001 [Leptodontidium sp. 2 PMI_412]|nr:hypothetical protein DL95DRAFT_399001 [Leptodontidium sp. 2 PMI_412]